LQYKSQSLSGYVQNCNDIKQKLIGELKWQRETKMCSICLRPYCRM